MTLFCNKSGAEHLLRCHTPALQRPPPVASQTPRCPDPTQPHYRNVVFSVFAPCVLCRLSSAALYIVRHPDCSSNPPAIPCCLGTINASKRACGALSPIVCQTAGHFQPLGAQDSTSSSLTLLRDPTMTTMPSTRKRTRAASHAEIDADVAAATAAAAALSVLLESDQEVPDDTDQPPPRRRRASARTAARRRPSPARPADRPPASPPARSRSSSPAAASAFSPSRRQAPPRPPPRRVPLPPRRPTSRLKTISLGGAATLSPFAAPIEGPDSRRASASDGRALGEISDDGLSPNGPRRQRADTSRGADPGARVGSSGVATVGPGRRGARGSTAGGSRPRASAPSATRAAGGRELSAPPRRQAFVSSSPFGMAPSPPASGSPAAAPRGGADLRRRANVPRPSRPPVERRSDGEEADHQCSCKRPRRGRAHTNGRGGFDLPDDRHAAVRTLEAPPPPLNNMPVYGNDDVGIPPDRVRYVRGLVRAAVKEYFTSYHTWGYQEWSDMRQAITYVEQQEPRLAICVRSWGACALLSRAINNKAA
ncbi:hypothetical protein BU14_0126s0005 [Porphyra umbilicalis]|uniref:Uncharacterized protein n=1 Tax=Porphyra umbilicalis TaxID=2786 RepID=A0A1X6PB46_PORUM|nr:hypothetical protein BU14_0126s0005 [Porphyra umbilicalis]|eukprot:OSX77966.1 hypothetical protein BU14_0126s0005 [Porphyra umbilicalis]